ncbi:MAG: flavodoxin family protein [Promethearchaeota archaeon]
MKVLFTYRTLTGNTKKVIEAMYDEIQVEKEIKPWNEIESLEGYNINFIGFPIEAMGPGHQTKEWLAEHVDGKRIALVITHGSPDDTQPLQEWLQKCRDAAVGAEIVGLFHCRGDMSEQLIEGMLQSGNPQFVEWAKQAKEAPRGFPDASALNKARTFAQDTINQLS